MWRFLLTLTEEYVLPIDWSLLWASQELALLGLFCNESKKKKMIIFYLLSCSNEWEKDLLKWLLDVDVEFAELCLVMLKTVPKRFDLKRLLSHFCWQMLWKRVLVMEEIKPLQVHI